VLNYVYSLCVCYYSVLSCVADVADCPLQRLSAIVIKYIIIIIIIIINDTRCPCICTSVCVSSTSKLISKTTSAIQLCSEGVCYWMRIGSHGFWFRISPLLPFDPRPEVQFRPFHRRFRCRPGIVTSHRGHFVVRRELSLCQPNSSRCVLTWFQVFGEHACSTWSEIQS